MSATLMKGAVADVSAAIGCTPIVKLNRLAAGLKRVQPPRISFPPNGATVAISGTSKPEPLPLKAKGGRAPLQWVINGTPVEDSTNPWWTPDAEGFAQITVVDADGRSDTAQIRLKADN
jgi:membrane carboxypeptidase/penicillin-binding protein PbpC